MPHSASFTALIAFAAALALTGAGTPPPQTPDEVIASLSATEAVAPAASAAAPAAPQEADEGEADGEGDGDGATREMAALPVGSASKLPLPRYVSLKSSRVNLRIGPGRDYPVSWLYLKGGLPVEIVQEFDLWRRIRDSEGTEGWVYHSLLSGDRTSIAAPWLAGKATVIDIHSKPAIDAPLVAQMEPGVVARVKECDAGWCELEVSSREGYVRQEEIWGVYPGEKF